MKERKYLIFWWAVIENGGFANGTVVITLQSGLTEEFLPDVTKVVRVNTGYSNAIVMAFSEFASE